MSQLTTATDQRELTLGLLQGLGNLHDQVTDAVLAKSADAAAGELSPERQAEILRAQERLLRFNDILDDAFDRIAQRHEHQQRSHADPAEL